MVHERGTFGAYEIPRRGIVKAAGEQIEGSKKEFQGERKRERERETKQTFMLFLS